MPHVNVPAVVVGRRRAIWLDPSGEVEDLGLKAAGERLATDPRVLVCHARMTADRLGTQTQPALDLLELFAFVRPARFCLPTPKGLAEALGLPLPGTPEAQAESLMRAADFLLGEIADTGGRSRDLEAIAWTMGRGGWAWAPLVLAAIDPSDEAALRREDRASAGRGLAVWRRLPDWEDEAPPPPPDTFPVEGVEARAQLAKLLGRAAEPRPQQRDYASEVAQAFSPRDKAGAPWFVMAEAGTGVGKTLGYIAPASVWAAKNNGSVWISTYTRNLQRQLDGELSRLYPNPAEKAEKVVVRKGRENYFCLLNFEEAVGRLSVQGGRGLVALGLVARWALATRDGDMAGGDFPAWLADLLGAGLTTDLTDTRGECVYSACGHYGKCFIEHSQRRARHAQIVVANHALVMIQAALGGTGMGDATETKLPLRYIFDEGHHVFDAADAAFSADLSGREMADLRRWLIGAEEGSRSRSRGLKARLEDLIAGDETATAALDHVLQAARALAGPGWRQRLTAETPRGLAETFLAAVRAQVFARTENPDTPYGLEVPTQPALPELLAAAVKLEAALAELGRPFGDLIGRLGDKLSAEADELDTSTRNRIEAVIGSMERRGLQQIAVWRSMLQALQADTPLTFVDWLAVDRIAGRETDVGLHRHWIDPTKPFAETLAQEAHGIVVTSATLRDQSGDGLTPQAWDEAEARTGVRHLESTAIHSAVPSPFDYPAQTRVLVVGDVARDDPDRVADAYRALFLAAGGGGLGLFTAIQRLRAVYGRIAEPLEEAGIPLLSQHIDALDTGTLIDIFRAEEDTCLLGTDAVRDGVDVPGRALRLIVFDRVPWPRPDLLHKARRDFFGGRIYDEMLTRLKLKQAYGRLIRRAGDHGVFVLLDRAFPSRLSSAFPEGVAVERVGLADTVETVRQFLAVPGGQEEPSDQPEDTPPN